MTTLTRDPIEGALLLLRTYRGPVVIEDVVAANTDYATVVVQVRGRWRVGDQELIAVTKELDWAAIAAARYPGDYVSNQLVAALQDQLRLDRVQRQALEDGAPLEWVRAFEAPTDAG